ncbi:MAG: glycosyltransferase family 9 protein [Kineosporiaceae bacterium]
MGDVLAVIGGPSRVDAAEPPVVVLRALGLGDLLTGVPALRGLRRAFGGRRLVLAAAHPAAAWLRDLGLVDDVLPVTGADVVAGLTGALSAELPAGCVAVNLHGSGPQSHRFLQAARPSRLRAYGCAPAGVEGPAWDAAEHEVLRWCRLVGAATGASCGVEDLLLHEALGASPRPSPAVARPGGRWVVVHPGAASPARQWPLERWAALTRALATTHRVLVTAGPGEDLVAHEVALRAGLHDPLAVRTGQSLPGLAATVAAASLLVSADTGVAHLANALDVPSVTIFGPTPPDRWRSLLHPQRHAVVYRGDGTQRPSAPEHDGVAGPDVTMLAVRVEDVLTAAVGVHGQGVPRSA